jgi:hypothetical protein
MKIFLDTANLDEIRHAADLGLIDSNRRPEDAAFINELQALESTFQLQIGRYHDKVTANRLNGGVMKGEL